MGKSASHAKCGWNSKWRQFLKMAAKTQSFSNKPNDCSVDDIHFEIGSNIYQDISTQQKYKQLKITTKSRLLPIWPPKITHIFADKQNCSVNVTNVNFSRTI